MSNNLQEGVATGGGEPAAPYCRATASSNASVGSSVKLSAAERKSAKGNHLEKVAITISEVIKSSLQSMNPTSPVALSSKRSEAYLSREAEQTLNLKLKRQREAIEAPSFDQLSPWLQRKLKTSYANTLNLCNDF